MSTSDVAIVLAVYEKFLTMREVASVVASSVCCISDQSHRQFHKNAYQVLISDISLVYPRQELIRNLPPHILPLLAIPFLTVRIQTRNRTRAEITRQPRRLQRAPSPPSAYERVPRTPKSVAGVVNVPNHSEDPSRACGTG
jgi:hypothetical protein